MAAVLIAKTLIAGAFNEPPKSQKERLRRCRALPFEETEMSQHRIVTVSILPMNMVNSFILVGERPVIVDTGIPGSAPSSEARRRRAVRLRLGGNDEAQLHAPACRVTAGLSSPQELSST